MVAGLHCTAGRGVAGLQSLQAEVRLCYMQTINEQKRILHACHVELFTALSYITRMLLVSRTGCALYRPYKARQCKQHPHGLGTTQKHHQFPGPISFRSPGPISFRSPGPISLARPDRTQIGLITVHHLQRMGLL